MWTDEPLEADRRVVLLTGAGGRLGNDFCQRYATTYDIAAVCRQRLPQVDDQDRTFFDPLDVSVGGRHRVYTIRADLAEPDEVDRVVELTLARFGRVDMLVNAAAHIERERLTASCEDSTFLDRALRVNATVPVVLAAAVARRFWDGRRQENRMLRRGVVNVSSGAGLGYVPSPGLGAYSASKVALNFLTCYLAEEFRGFGVRVNAIAPTTFPDLIPTARVSDQIAALDKSDGTGEIVEML